MPRPPRESTQKKTTVKSGKKNGFTKYIPLALLFIALSVYLGGLVCQLTAESITTDGWNYVKPPIDYGIFACINIALATSSGIQTTLLMAGTLGIAIFLLKTVFGKSKDLYDERNFNKSEKGTYGTSGWMDKEDIPNNFDLKPIEATTGTVLGELDGDVVSLPLKSRLNKHTAIYGASGTGKSRCFVRSQVMQCVARGESIIITDPKGELYADTAQFMKNNGYNVKVFNLVDPKFSDSWNCLREIMADPGQVELMAQTFADVVIKNTMEGGKGDHFWDNAEMGLLKALILYVILDEQRPEESKNIGAVYEMLTNNSETELNSCFDKLRRNHPALKPWSIFKQSSESVRGNVIVGLGSRIQVFQSPDIMKITQFDEIDLEAPAREKCGYFVIMSDQNSTLDFLSSLFFSFLFIRLVKYADVYGKNGACDIPVNFVLDEFPNIGQIPDFTKKLSTIRSRELRVAVIFQNIAQLQNRYPNGLWEEIIGNCDTQLFLGCTDQMTAKFISERTGEMTVEVNSHQQRKDALTLIQYVPQYNETKSIGKRAVLTPDEVMRLPSDNALIILRGQKVLKVQKYDYSKHPTSKEFVYTPVRDHTPDWRKAFEAASQDSLPDNVEVVGTSANPILAKVDLTKVDVDDDDMLPVSKPVKAPAPVKVNQVDSSESEQPPVKKTADIPIMISNPNVRGGSPRPYNAAAFNKSNMTMQEAIQSEIDARNQQQKTTLYAKASSVAIPQGSNKSTSVPLDF